MNLLFVIYLHYSVFMGAVPWCPAIVAAVFTHGAADLTSTDKLSTITPSGSRGGAIRHTSNTRHDRYLQIITTRTRVASIYHYYYHTSNKCDRCRRPDECFIWDLNLDNPGSNNVHRPPCHWTAPRTGEPSPCLCPGTGS